MGTGGKQGGNGDLFHHRMVCALSYPKGGVIGDMQGSFGSIHDLHIPSFFIVSFLFDGIINLDIISRGMMFYAVSF